MDNYLSDTHRLDYSRRVKFLEIAFMDLTRIENIGLLPRNWVNGRRVYAADIVSELRRVEISAELKKRLRWRLYDQQDVGNLHDRELILRKRRTVFRLPPARIVIGQDDVGNETDTSAAFSSSLPTLEAWKAGINVINGGRSSC